jgi:hypothetical protein
MSPEKENGPESDMPSGPELWNLLVRYLGGDDREAERSA